jgi:hypothetical protein
MIDRFVGRTRVAYFSMEIAISPEMPTYSGGLGILAGGTARAAADLDLPMVFATLVSRTGYLRQELDAQGRQGDVARPLGPAALGSTLPCHGGRADRRPAGLGPPLAAHAAVAGRRRGAGPVAGFCFRCFNGGLTAALLISWLRSRTCGA